MSKSNKFCCIVSLFLTILFTTSAKNVIAATSYSSINQNLDTIPLIVSQQPPSYLLKGSSATVGFTIRAGYIPSGSGEVKVSLGSYYPDRIKLPAKCYIRYLDGDIINQEEPDSCSKITIEATDFGSDYVHATVSGGVQCPTRLIMLPKSFSYVLHKNSISTFINLEDNSLYKILNSEGANYAFPETNSEATQMTIVTLKNSNKVLYVTNVTNNMIDEYEIDSGKAIPVRLLDKISTGGIYPIKIILSSNKMFAYVLNSKNIAKYKIDSNTGHLILIGVTALPDDMTNAGTNSMSITKINEFEYLYVAGNKRNLAKVNLYKINQETGDLTLDKNGSWSINSKDLIYINSIATSPDGKWLMVGTVDGNMASVNNYAYMLEINQSNGYLTKTAFSIKQNIRHYDVYFSPKNVAFIVNETSITPYQYWENRWNQGVAYKSNYGLNYEIMSFSKDGTTAYNPAKNTSYINEFTINDSAGIAYLLAKSPSNIDAIHMPLQIFVDENYQ